MTIAIAIKRKAAAQWIAADDGDARVNATSASEGNERAEQQQKVRTSTIEHTNRPGHPSNKCANAILIIMWSVSVVMINVINLSLNHA